MEVEGYVDISAVQTSFALVNKYKNKILIYKELFMKTVVFRLEKINESIIDNNFS